VRATVCRPADLGAPEIERWHRFQMDAGLESPFLSPEFALAAGEVFASTRVAIVHDGPDLVGFLPFTDLGFRAASALGGYGDTLQAFIHADTEWTFEAILSAARIESFQFGRLLASQRPASASATAMESQVIGYETFLARAIQSGGGFVKRMERQRRRLERDDPELRRRQSGRLDILSFPAPRAQCPPQHVRRGRGLLRRWGRGGGEGYDGGVRGNVRRRASGGGQAGAGAGRRGAPRGMSLKVAICRPGELGPGEMEQWRRCVAGSRLAARSSPRNTPSSSEISSRRAAVSASFMTETTSSGSSRSRPTALAGQRDWANT